MYQSGLRLTVPHAELASVSDTSRQVLAHLGVSSDEPGSTIKELRAEFLNIGRL